jgi:hypothetical protein
LPSPIVARVLKYLRLPLISGCLFMVSRSFKAEVK